MKKIYTLSELKDILHEGFMLCSDGIVLHGDFEEAGVWCGVLDTAKQLEKYKEQEDTGSSTLDSEQLVVNGMILKEITINLSDRYNLKIM
jgi:hypothetical protein